MLASVPRSSQSHYEIYCPGKCAFTYAAKSVSKLKIEHKLQKR